MTFRDIPVRRRVRPVSGRVPAEAGGHADSRALPEPDFNGKEA